MSWSPLSKPGMVSLTLLAEGKRIATHKHPLPAGDAVPTVVTRKTTGGFRAYQRRSQDGDLSSISVRHDADHGATTACEGEARRHVCPSLERNSPAEETAILVCTGEGILSWDTTGCVGTPGAGAGRTPEGRKGRREAEN